MSVMRGWVLAGAALSLTGLLVGCSLEQRLPPAESTFGDPQRGRALVSTYGCGSCHIVPGVRNADGLVGPPLIKFGKRSYIAGQLPNNAQNLQRWIRDPVGVEPGTAMPDLGVPPLDARDLAAYLLSLE